MVAVAAHALVRAEVNATLLLEGFCRLESRSLRVVHHLLLPGAGCDVAVDVKEAPRIARDEEVPEESQRRSLVLQRENDVAELHVLI